MTEGSKKAKGHMRSISWGTECFELKANENKAECQKIGVLQKRSTLSFAQKINTSYTENPF